MAHLHGGEVTFGAIDDVFRHSITKCAHLHFVSIEDHARRVIQLGEEPWRVTVCGALALEGMTTSRTMTAREELERRLGCPFDPPPLLVTFHPVTLEYEQAGWQTSELLAALDQVSSGGSIVFTLPNADTGGAAVRPLIEAYVARTPHARLVANFGEDYPAMMVCAGAMVGNSSSGLIEAPSFELPVVNIGIRQDGRTRGINVIDTGHGRAEIAEALARALSPAFRHGLSGMENPYHRPGSASIIVRTLLETALDSRLTNKRFHDLTFSRQDYAGPGGIR